MCRQLLAGDALSRRPRLRQRRVVVCSIDVKQTNRLIPRDFSDQLSLIKSSCPPPYLQYPVQVVPRQTGVLLQDSVLLGRVLSRRLLPVGFLQNLKDRRPNGEVEDDGRSQHGAFIDHPERTRRSDDRRGSLRQVPSHCLQRSRARLLPARAL